MDTKFFIEHRIDEVEEKLQQIYNLAMDLDSMSNIIVEFTTKFGDSEFYEASVYDHLEDLITIVHQASMGLDLIHNSLYRELKHFRSHD